MTQLERQLRIARRLLIFNRWFVAASLFATAAIILFAILALVNRLYDLHWPLTMIGILFAFAALLGSLVMISIRSVGVEFAAAKLDEAAGLRERLSSGWYCRERSDDFASAVLADAEQVSGNLTVSQHIRLQAPPRWGLPLLAAIAAAAVFLISPGVLKSNEAKKEETATTQRDEARTVVKKQLEDVKKIADNAPALDDLQAELKALDAPLTAQLQNPGDLRHEAIKKLDRLEDAIKAKRSTDEYEAVPQLQKMLRGLKVPESADAATEKLTKALQSGDFKAAKEEVQALKDQLATLKSDADKEFAQKAEKQLEDLAKQLEKLAQNEDLAKQLEKAGIKKEDVDRLLERLSKQDIEQIKKQLEEKGINPAQAEKLAKQLQQKGQAGEMAQKLAQALKQAGQGKDQAGQSGAAAAAALSDAGQQLSDLEKLEQEMNQLESAMASVQNAKDALDKQCPS